jgi:hypothetical protein
MLQAQKKTTGSKVYYCSQRGSTIHRCSFFMNTGNLESMFVDGFDRCLKVAADYGGVVKIHGLFGVREMHYPASITYDYDVWPPGRMALRV